MSYFDDNEDYLINKKGMPMPKKKPRLKTPNEVTEQPKSKSSLFTRGYDDVRRKVENDCLDAKKNDELETLMRKYRVEIDKEVLKTVNRAGNK